MQYKFENEIESLVKEEDAIKSSVALNKILHSLLIESRKRELRLWIVILSLLATMMCGIIGFFIYESQFETTETKTETSTETTYSYAEASGENAAINNIQGDQYNDQARRNNYYKEEME